MTDRCLAFTKTGERCRNGTGQSGKYCNVHKEAFEEVESFFSKNRDHVIGFLLGLATETVVRDGYDELKRLLPGRRESSHAPGEIGTLIRDLRGFLNHVIIEDRSYLVEHVLARKSAGKFAIYECLHERESYDLGRNRAIFVYYLDELGRRHVGDIDGFDVEADDEALPTGLVCRHEFGCGDGRILSSSTAGRGGTGTPQAGLPSMMVPGTGRWRNSDRSGKSSEGVGPWRSRGPRSILLDYCWIWPAMSSSRSRVAGSFPS